MQYQALVLRAIMATVPQATLDLSMSQDAFFDAIAHGSATQYTGVSGMLEGPYMDLMGCLYGTLAVNLLDGYKRVST